MIRKLILKRIAPFTPARCRAVVLCGISKYFYLLSPSLRQIVHALLTRPPLSGKASIRKLSLRHSVRLACVKHAASVHPEPGSNSWFFCIYIAFALHISISLIVNAHSLTFFLRKLLINLFDLFFMLSNYKSKKINKGLFVLDNVLFLALSLVLTYLVFMVRFASGFTKRSVSLSY